MNSLEIEAALARLQAVMPRLPKPEGLDPKLVAIIDRINDRHQAFFRGLVSGSLIMGRRLAELARVKDLSGGLASFMAGLTEIAAVLEGVQENTRVDSTDFNLLAEELGCMMFIGPDLRLAQRPIHIGETGVIYPSPPWED
jgi:hypothetical protein